MGIRVCNHITIRWSNEAMTLREKVQNQVRDSIESIRRIPNAILLDACEELYGRGEIKHLFKFKYRDKRIDRLYINAVDSEGQKYTYLSARYGSSNTAYLAEYDDFVNNIRLHISKMTLSDKLKKVLNDDLTALHYTVIKRYLERYNNLAKHYAVVHTAGIPALMSHVYNDRIHHIESILDLCITKDLKHVCFEDLEQSTHSFWYRGTNVTNIVIKK